MATETERKFLIQGDYTPFVKKSVRIVQGYLCSVPERSVRVRIKGNKGFITVKGIGNNTGTSRFEWEQEIALSDAEEMLKLCEPGIIDKTRHLIPAQKHTFEVDEFHGENQGLVLAEIELDNENEAFDRPEWLGKEVTGDLKYYNISLIKKPYKDWPVL